MNTSGKNNRRIIWLAIAVLTSITGLLFMVISRFDPSLLFLSGLFIGVSLCITIRLLFNSRSKKQQNLHRENDDSP
jgi:xanthine/uracil permease